MGFAFTGTNDGVVVSLVLEATVKGILRTENATEIIKKEEQGT